MSYIKIKGKQLSRLADKSGSPTWSDLVSLLTSNVEFYQFEPAVVLDTVLDACRSKDETYNSKGGTKRKEDMYHPITKYKPCVNVPATPKTDVGEAHKQKDLDFKYIGMIKIRRLFSESGDNYSNLEYAFPLDRITTEIPLINEIVNVVDLNGQLFYSNRICLNNFMNANPDFSAEIRTFDMHNGSNSTNGRPVDPNSAFAREKDNSSPLVEYAGPENRIYLKCESNDDPSFRGILGKYFVFNRRIRKLKRFEGDSIIESRFGQSIRFGAYDENGYNDIGDKRYKDYYMRHPGSARGSDVPETGGGNPMLLIRNRQRPINQIPKTVGGDSDPTDIDMEYENQYHSDILESINWDGSSIHMTSGLTKTKWNWNYHFKKKHFSSAISEEQSGYSGTDQRKSSRWELPDLVGDQIIHFSDRLIFGSRSEETLMFSKKRFAIVSDQEYTVDAHEQIVFTTNEKVVFNSPHIFLGEYNQTREPAVLGETCIEWLYALCEWLEKHQHWYHHTHPDAGGGHDGSSDVGDSKQPYTQVPVSQHVLILQNMKKQLPEILSKRVFLTGGGYATGFDGVEIGGLRNDRVGKYDKTPGGYFTNRVHQHNGFPSTGTTNGMVEPEAFRHSPTANPHIKSRPDGMKSSH